MRQRPRGGVELGLVDAQLAQTLAHIGLGLVADGVVVTECLVKRVREARLERRGIFAAVNEPAWAHDECALLTRQALFLGKGAQGDGLPEALVIRLAHEHEVEAVVRGSKDLRGHLGHDACRRGELRGAEDDKRAVGHAGTHEVDAGRLCPRVHVAVVGVCTGVALCGPSGEDACCADTCQGHAGAGCGQAQTHLAGVHGSWLLRACHVVPFECAGGLGLTCARGCGRRSCSGCSFPRAPAQWGRWTRRSWTRGPRAARWR